LIGPLENQISGTRNYHEKGKFGKHEKSITQYSKTFCTQITQIKQIYADGMQGSLEPPQRGVPNAATLGNMESPVNEKQASLFFIIWVSI
jgi:hypothetical protein